MSYSHDWVLTRNNKHLPQCRLSDYLKNYAADLQALQQAHLYRKRQALESHQGPVVNIQNKTYLNFCSNDYLGLANDPRLIQSAQQALEEYGLGSGASPLVCGRNKQHALLEEKLAEFTQRDKALLFSCGYQANLSLCSVFADQRDDVIIQDKLNHASMIDGALLSPAKLVRYQHGDSRALVQQLDKHRDKRKLVLTDAVFSMDGDMAPLVEIAEQSKQHETCLVVDDAHGFGVLGENGKGSLEHVGLNQNDVPLMMATFGKSLGGYGAFVAGPESLIETIIQKARPYIYSTATPTALAASALTALEIVSAESWRREHVTELIHYFKQSAAQLELPLLDSQTPIQPLLIGTSQVSVSISQTLYDKGLLISAIRPPTVPKDTARLRITITAAHQREHIDQLIDVLDQVIPTQLKNVV